MLWEAIIDTFVAVPWYVVLLLVMGIVFCLIEGIIPGFGIFGILGIACEVGGIVVHGIVVTNAVQTAILVVTIVIALFILATILISSAKKGLLGKSALFSSQTTLPKDYDKQFEAQKLELIGKEGIIESECRPVGKMRIGNDIIEVMAKSKVIEKGEVVKIVDVEGIKIIVDKIDF